MRFLHAAGVTKPNWRRIYVVNSFGILLPVVILTAAAIYSLQFMSQTQMPFTDSNFLAIVILVVGSSFAGFIDDLLGSRAIGGIRGHFSQLKYGIMTSGTLKAVLGVALAIIVASLYSPNILFLLLNSAIITLSMNAANLCDLRPGRAVKFFALAALAVFAVSYNQPFWQLWSFILPPVVALLWGDLREESMLGDAGSNCLGAILGLTFVVNLHWQTNLVILILLVGLHLYTEKYSLTETIAQVPILREFDAWGVKK